MADKYNLMRAFYDLVDQSQGLPKGTTPIGSLPLEKLIEMGKELAEYIAIMQWGTIGICGIILHEYKESCNKRTLRSKMEPYSYPWATAFTQQEMVAEMLDCNKHPISLSLTCPCHLPQTLGNDSSAPEERLFYRQHGHATGPHRLPGDDHAPAMPDESDLTIPKY